MTRSRVVDRAAFAKLRRIAPALSSARRDDVAVRETPDEVSFKLTNRCNLRCTHCYEWNEDGYHHDLEPSELNSDLDIAVVEKVLDATRELGSNVYLWGGEPLLYRHWNALVALLAEHRRWTSMCTNGVLVEKRLESLLRISERLELVLALDGFEDEHDALRGQGMFSRTYQGLERLVREKQAGRFLGEITVNCVFQDAMIGKLHDFVVFLERAGVDNVYLSYPWHLSPESAAKMDVYVAAHFPLMTLRAAPGTASWHSYTFGLSPELVQELRKDLARIDAESWKLKLRYNPELADSELEGFIAGSDLPAGGRTRCHALRSRLDVLPNGEVVSCKFFPEFTVGNLTRSELKSVWHGRRFDQVRETVRDCGLMPVCAKCPLLYTRGA
jgi:radical SAM protein with 4Fe4S-binding SPASM domain